MTCKSQSLKCDFKYVFNERGKYAHIVRTVSEHKLGNREPHISVHYLCGNSSSGKKIHRFLNKLDELNLCKACFLKEWTQKNGE